MARIRYIKPGFFLDDELAEVQPLGRILFAALWCVADREGRLEDRPRRIKTEALPYDDVDVNTLLDELATAGFITRYESGGRRYIAVSNFSRHQVPFNKEPASVIPEPPSLPLASAKLGPSFFEGTIKGKEQEKEPSSDDDAVLTIAVDNPPDLFTLFWQRYPRKVGKATAAESWKRLNASERRAAIIGAGNLAKWGKSKDKQFIPHPTTWLNQRRWEDWCNGPPDGYASSPSTGIDRCPKCGTDLSADEHGPHCPMCEWRPR